MKIDFNIDGSVTIECNGTVVTATPPPGPKPAGGGTGGGATADPPIAQGGISAFMLHPGRLEASARHALVDDIKAHVAAKGLARRDDKSMLRVAIAGSVDITALRLAMTKAGIDASTGIELTGVTDD